MNLGGHPRLKFGDFELDLSAPRLFRQGTPVKIQPQPLRILCILVENPGELVSRDELRTRVWGDATFVEFDQGLNFSIRQIRLALQDVASQPAFIETLPKQGYRFIATVSRPVQESEEAPPAAITPAAIPPRAGIAPPASNRNWILAGTAALLLIAAVSMYPIRSRSGGVRYTQLTDFTDSATAPALSPDGRMVAFYRGGRFLTADQIWVKMLSGGEAKRLTNDTRLKYNVSFSPDASEVAYTAIDTNAWNTYTVPVLGGDARQFLDNAAGLSWLDPGHLLFSVIRAGQHMGVVTATPARAGVRELYFPENERGMAHYSYASPDRRVALVVEMDAVGGWGSCRLISLADNVPAKTIGPAGSCTAAGWSPDGAWMYFSATVSGHSHLWRQPFPRGAPEQITFGPTEEEGMAVEPDGRSVITSAGVVQSSIWIHDEHGDRSLSSEGEVQTGQLRPAFDADGKTLYYLLRRSASGVGAELWRTNVETGSRESVFPGVEMLSFALSLDGKQLVYSTEGSGGKAHMWLAPSSGKTPAKPIGGAGDSHPHFGPRGRILFQSTEGNFNYLEQINSDGSGRSRAVPFPVNQIVSVSPEGKWVVAIAPLPAGGERGAQMVAIPVEGGPTRRLCLTLCSPNWSPDGKFLYISLQERSRTGLGRSLAIPVGPGETLPDFPAEGVKPNADTSVIPGSKTVDRSEFVPGIDPDHYAYVNTTVHRNLYRVSLP